MLVDFYRTHRARLVNFAVARLGNKEEAEDLVQDVFVKLVSYECVVNKATIQSFVFTIANNEVKNILRRRLFRHRMEEYVTYESELQHCAVERVVEYHDMLCIVQHCMDELSPTCAKVYRMSLFEDKCAGDIAKELNVSKRTIESQLFASRKQMRVLVKAM